MTRSCAALTASPPAIIKELDRRAELARLQGTNPTVSALTPALDAMLEHATPVLRRTLAGLPESISDINAAQWLTGWREVMVTAPHARSVAAYGPLENATTGHPARNGPFVTSQFHGHLPFPRAVVPLSRCRHRCPRGRVVSHCSGADPLHRRRRGVG